MAACRLAWQWFWLNQAAYDGKFFKKRFWLNEHEYRDPWPPKQDYIDRKVAEPEAVRLAGEYHVWDKRDANAELLQYGLVIRENNRRDEDSVLWYALLSHPMGGFEASYLDDILKEGAIAQNYVHKTDANIMRGQSFVVDWEGLKWLALNTARCNSNTFLALDVPETGHDALLGFYWNGRVWSVSLYHARHRTDLDLSEIAVKHGGGGHPGACGFTWPYMPFVDGIAPFQALTGSPTTGKAEP